MLTEPVSVLVLGYNRPSLLQEVLAHIPLATCKQIYVSLDGPRGDRHRDRQLVAECEEIAHAQSSRVPTQVLTRDANLGCKKAVSDGISWFFRHEDEGLILEDDTWPEPEFFSLGAHVLNNFRRDESVALFSGSNFVPETLLSSTAALRLTRYPHIWGWGTWRDRWNKYQVSIPSYRNYRRLWKLFVWSGCSVTETAYWLRQFRRVRTGSIDTWDYQLVHLVVDHQLRILSSNRNLVTNVGWGPDSTHTSLAPRALPTPTPVEPLDTFGKSVPAWDRSADIWERRNVFRASPLSLLRRYLEAPKNKPSYLHDNQS